MVMEISEQRIKEICWKVWQADGMSREEFERHWLQCASEYLNAVWSWWDELLARRGAAEATARATLDRLRTTGLVKVPGNPALSPDDWNRNPEVVGLADLDTVGPPQ